MMTEPKPGRFAYLDNLRAVAMLAGLLFHAALAYSPKAHGFWLSADPAQYPLFDVLAWASHLFRMPLFFFIAGFFTALLWQKAGGVAFAKNRLQRVALPLLLFLPLLTLAMHAVIHVGLSVVEQPSALLQLIKPMLVAGSQTRLPLSTMHLWFLYHLLFLYVLTYCARVLLSDALQKHLLALKSRSLLLLLLCLLLPPLWLVPAPVPAPDWIFPALWALWFYGLFFACGYVVYHHAGALARYDADRRLLLMLGALSYAVFYLLLPADLLAAQPLGWAKLLMTLCEASGALCWTLAALLYAKRYLNRSNKVLRYLSAVSYWVYLVHLPLLFLLQFGLTDLSWPAGVKYLAAVLLTLSGCLLSYHLLVVPTVLGKLFAPNQGRADSPDKPLHKLL
ncbi:acyltransferase family protein [Rheinheimera texasensis]|uniref:acyltransferase family protein n=1 Tax=Rheinheimera texasensis TaxID=306205 RepID=UPI0004E22C4B|nr:acyltransferase family protein [Rheinheimera texasensis]